MPPSVRYAVPGGGMFFWATIAGDVDTQALLSVAAHDNVVFVPGRPFYPRRDGRDGMRLNFSNSGDDAIRMGIARLAQAIREFEGGR